METMTAQAFAERVLAAFEDAGRATDAQVVAAGGPSTTTMTKFRAVARGEADMAEPREPTWTKIDLAAAWAPGSARRVWRGQDPVAMGQKKASISNNMRNRMVPQLVAELEGRVDELEQIVQLLLTVVDVDDSAAPEDVDDLRSLRNAVVHGSAGSGKTASMIHLLKAQREAGNRVDTAFHVGINSLELAAHDEEHSIEDEQGTDAP